jgi:hypothetical protein
MLKCLYFYKYPHEPKDIYIMQVKCAIMKKIKVPQQS